MENNGMEKEYTDLVVIQPSTPFEISTENSICEEKSPERDTSSGCEDFCIPEDDPVLPVDPNFEPIESTSVDEVSPNTCEIAPPNESTKGQDLNERPLSRKRKCRPELWKSNVKKMKVNSGQAYYTITKKQKDAKAVKGVCGKTCRLQCSTKIPQGKQIQVNKSFWKLGDHGLQRNFVVSNSHKVTPQYRYLKEGSGRGYNIAYYFTIDESRIRVCKQFFMKTLDIGDKFIRNCWKKIDECGVLEKEKRGKHTKKKVDDGLKEQVRAHIRSFPKIESHYLRAQTSKEYLDGSLTIAEMYRLYTENQVRNKLPAVKLNVYREIFNTEFNLSFFVPKKDQCALCQSYTNSSEEEREKVQARYDDHNRNKLLSREEKSKDANLAREGSLIVACFDLQAVLQVPCGDISVLYYKRKLNCFNFTIFDVGKKEGFCFFWNESIAKRGVNEIGSCIQIFLQENCQTQQPVVFYSDNAAGQNKNKAIASLYLFAVQTLSIPRITHKYLVSGHSQNEGDSMHATIERQKKRSLKSGPIYTPTQWTPLIQTAKKVGKPYSVRELATENFNDLKKLAKEMGSNYNVNEDGQKVNWNSLRVIEARKDSPNILFYKTDYEESDFKTILVKRSQRGHRLSVPVLHQAYQNAPKLPRNKVKDLLDLCSSGVIPRIHHPFFNNLQVQEENNEDEGDEDNDQLEEF